MRKDIKDLTDEDCQDILNYVYPQDNITYKSSSHDIVPNEDGSIQLSLGMRPLVGIKYHNGQDNCILHFDNTKVVSWLYKNGYGVGSLLEENEYLSNVEQDLEELCYRLHYRINHGENDLDKQEVQNWINEYFYDTDY